MSGPDRSGRLSYQAGPESPLAIAKGGLLGQSIKAWVKIGNRPGRIFTVPYNGNSARYDLELWGYDSRDLRVFSVDDRSTP